MRRVRIIHTLRPVISGAALASVLLVVAVWGIGREVWVAHVIQNLELSAAAGHLGQFILAAFMNTRAAVQLLTLATLAAAAWLVADAIRVLRSNFRLA